MIEALTYDDVLLLPHYSDIRSRSEVDISTDLGNGLRLELPIISSPMDTVSEDLMARAISEEGGCAIIHRYNTPEEQAQLVGHARVNGAENIGFAVGVGGDLLDRTEKCLDAGASFVCVDVANGYMSKLVTFVKRIRTQWPKMIIACGNVVSREMVEELIINGGADIVKVGIGSGSVCTTRIQTGVGMPQLSAVAECADAAHGINGTIISDGGVTCPGDVAKAFGGGADFVMLGSMLAGHVESAGEVIEEDGKKYKVFYGMSSSTAMNKYHGGVAKYRSSEGKKVVIPLKNSLDNTIRDNIPTEIELIIIENIQFDKAILHLSNIFLDLFLNFLGIIINKPST